MDEKIDKYMDFAAEVRRQFRVKTVIVPIFRSFEDNLRRTIRMDGETENRKHNLKFPVHIPIYIYI